MGWVVKDSHPKKRGRRGDKIQVSTTLPKAFNGAWSILELGINDDFMKVVNTIEIVQIL